MTYFVSSESVKQSIKLLMQKRLLATNIALSE